VRRAIRSKGTRRVRGCFGVLDLRGRVPREDVLTGGARRIRTLSFTGEQTLLPRDARGAARGHRGYTLRRRSLLASARFVLRGEPFHGFRGPTVSVDCDVASPRASRYRTGIYRHRQGWRTRPIAYLDLIDAARSRRDGQPKAWQEWPCDAVAALPPVGAARRRADAGTAAPKGEISGLDPRAVFPREAALTRRIGGSLCRSIAPNRMSLPRSPLPRPIPVRSVSVSKTGVSVSDIDGFIEADPNLEGRFDNSPCLPGFPGVGENSSCLSALPVYAEGCPG
jgi:hypothetical protein